MYCIKLLTLSMLRQLCPKHKVANCKPCDIGFHWIALTEYSQMSTHMPGFQLFSAFLCHFVLAKLATSSIWVNYIGHVTDLCVLFCCFQIPSIHVDPVEEPVIDLAVGGQELPNQTLGYVGVWVVTITGKVSCSDNQTSITITTPAITCTQLNHD